jgi:hypothetical protein
MEAADVHAALRMNVANHRLLVEGCILTCRNDHDCTLVFLIGKHRGGCKTC